MKLFKRLTFFFITLVGIISCLPEDTNDLIDDRDQFLGTWNVSESCAKDAYSVNIVKDPSNSSQVLIKNFWNTGNCTDYTYAIVAGSSLYITKQSICSNSFEVDGNGTLNKQKINLEYSINDGADLYTCSATYSKP